ncbi:Myb-like DNA-binding domain containing protein [Trichomonas vaginalis G3]|uniref:Myb-like DNA-binding domain containing protein n=1 Tax=Trichomonas vaginalis (strain ATCC PRA-98 / G3) TaxID=412133 RepID=A2DUL7_TRIV3|nr:RNA polymerase II transcription regulator recruiting protein [Trichomonas vaginalis G3]EAY15908.1 Myb-like DNA-binding domain containing protein [Trichomonas vaginalis G3]KAI5506631.1 RNA polymerase II transcription regulator recruiting protein [Trichomonas vaginalis G3]|eukprot:XP_001328131.1 Myb-like DNA-binding domain containing protein [Trichomonas vaginalis G3]
MSKMQEIKRIVRNKFTKEEDDKLKSLVNSMQRDRKAIDWHIIAKLMVTKNPRQCKDRWFYYLDSNVNLGPFTPEENYKILWSVHQYGKKWTAISQLFPHRTDVSIKAQYKKLLRRNATFENVFQLNTSQIIKAEKSEDREKSQIIQAEIDSSFFELDEMESQFD